MSPKHRNPRPPSKNPTRKRLPEARNFPASSTRTKLRKSWLPGFEAGLSSSYRLWDSGVQGLRVQVYRLLGEDSALDDSCIDDCNTSGAVLKRPSFCKSAGMGEAVAEKDQQ